MRRKKRRELTMTPATVSTLSQSWRLSHQAGRPAPTSRSRPAPDVSNLRPGGRKRIMSSKKRLKPPSTSQVITPAKPAAMLIPVVTKMNRKIRLARSSERWSVLSHLSRVVATVRLRRALRDHASNARARGWEGLIGAHSPSGREIHGSQFDRGVGCCGR